MLKILKVLLCAAIVGSISFTACTKKKDPKSEKIVVTGIWGESSSEGPAVLSAIEAAKAAGYNVEYQIIPHSEYLTLINAQAAAGDVSEIFAVQGGMVDRFAKGGIMKDITEEMDAEWKNKYDPSLLKEFSDEGRNYAIPALKIQTHVIFYNKLLLKKIGYSEFPKTWDDFKAMIVKAKSEGITPIALGNKNKWVAADPVASTLIERMIGKDWFERFAKKEARFDEPLFIEGLKKFKELVDIGAFNADANSLDNHQQQSLFYKGNSLMFIEGSWAIGKIAKDAPEELKENLGFAIYPAISGGKGDASEVTIGSGWGFAIKNDMSEEKQKTAIEVLKFFSSDAYGEKLLATNNLSTIRNVKAKDGDVDPLFEQFNREITSKVKPVPILMVITPSSILDITGVGLQNIMLGKTTPEELAKKMQEDIEKFWANQKK